MEANKLSVQMVGRYSLFSMAFDNDLKNLLRYFGIMKKSNWQEYDFKKFINMIIFNNIYVQ